MSCFPDTSFLCALYRTQSNSPVADACMADIIGTLWVSGLLLLEFRQSVRLQIRLHGTDRTKGISRSEGQQMLKDLQIDLNAGLLNVMPVDWSGPCTSVLRSSAAPPRYLRGIASRTFCTWRPPFNWEFATSLPSTSIRGDWLRRRASLFPPDPGAVILS